MTVLKHLIYWLVYMCAPYTLKSSETSPTLKTPCTLAWYASAVPEQSKNVQIDLLSWPGVPCKYISLEALDV